MEVTAILILGVIWAYREIMHSKMVDMLTDKLMARNFEEYKELTSEPKVYEPVEVDDQKEWAMEQKEITQ